MLGSEHYVGLIMTILKSEIPGSLLDSLSEISTIILTLIGRLLTTV